MLLQEVSDALAKGVSIAQVNVMAMDYGSANDNGGNMLLSAQQAAQATRNQTGDMIGITPMIGINDTNTEFFTLANASALVTWAKGQSYINRLAFWSLARDNGSCPNQGFASPVCSGTRQPVNTRANEVTSACVYPPSTPSVCNSRISRAKFSLRPRLRFRPAGEFGPNDSALSR